MIGCVNNVVVVVVVVCVEGFLILKQSRFVWQTPCENLVVLFPHFSKYEK